MKFIKHLQHLLAAFLASAGLAPSLIGQGINKQTVIKKQVSLGTPASGAGGQILRREQSVFTLAKGTYKSDEIVSHKQGTGVRHGVHATTGKIDGLISAGTYKLLWATACRADFVAGSTSGPLVNVTAAFTAGSQGTFTRAAGSWITDGFRIGDVVRWGGWAGGSAVNNNTHNMLIIALTATVMTVTTLDGAANPVVSDAAGDSVTATVVGKKTKVPLTAHTDDIFTFEEWYPDVSQSELFTDVRLNQASVDIPGNGNCKASFDLPGLKRTLGVAQVLTTPTSETLTSILAAATGVLIVNGAQQLVVTGLKLQIDRGYNVDGPVVGSLYNPDAALGDLQVSGSFSAYFQDQSFTLLYQAETVMNLVMVACGDTTASADFVAFNLGRLKLTGDAPDDGKKGIVRTLPFTAEINSAGGAGLANDQTILSIQDSQA
jgi:hypothetical protein